MEPGAWYACLPLHVVYSYDPLPGPWQELQAEGLGQDEVGSKQPVEQSMQRPAVTLTGSSNLHAVRHLPQPYVTTTPSHRVCCEPSQQRRDSCRRAFTCACLHTINRAVVSSFCLLSTTAITASLQAEGSDGAVDAVMSSAPGSTGEAGGGSPTASRHMMEDSSSGGGGADGGDTAAQPPPQQPPADATTAAAAAAAVVHPAAAEAAGPHYPGHPPGASLAPLAAAAAPAAASAGSSGGSSGRQGRQGVLSDAEAAHILGSQANLWTEYVADEATAEYMLLPRLAALAEAVW